MTRSVLTFVGTALFLNSTLLGQPSTTFTGNAGTNWHTPGNWTNNVPNSGKDAYIPDDKLCVISEETAEAARVFIYSEATLRIESQALNLYGIYDYLPHIEVDGKLEFKKTGSATPGIFGKTRTLQVWGTGLIDARSANGLGPGRIVGDSIIELFLQPTTDPLEVRGSVTIEPVDYLYLSDGKLIVDNANDIMNIGLDSSGSITAVVYSHENALIKASAGVIYVNRVQFGATDNDWRGKIRVEGTGVFKVGNFGASHTGKGAFEVAGGELDFQSTWTNTAAHGGHLTHTAGKIKVKSGKTASFE